MAETIEMKPTPSEQSTSTPSVVTDTTKPADGEPTPAPSLFDDIEMPHTQEADFFGTIGNLCGAILDHVQILHQSFVQHSSVAVTFSSRLSSAANESPKSNTFRIYPFEESEADRLVTKALVLGDFGGAISLCLSTEWYANAILLAVNKCPDSKGLL